ncbi:MAG TPA: MBOAT family O-acyltransferase [Candidatus Omnitrophota bacterium]|jgi:D-alanyl-lipoteichoic acid acyltransferase DltB (MBOAT superfamily)|nr:MBOAT family O-acyltransferase [Candidatus Omnitrophota bacterium]HPN56944.1 MBOAT family O-acyltransferase [Candidatus Omnitrophota bacterium]
MLFNSLAFALFLPLTLIVYWGLSRNLRVQNLFVMVMSYFFYGWWDARFLALLYMSTIIDFFAGQKIYTARTLTRKRIFLAVSLIANLGILGFFKYCNFFMESFVLLLGRMGWPAHLPALRIILPVGISFYTFQTLSYTIDIYRRRIEPTKDFIAFSAFVSFFPQLVAGPIERARNLLGQFLQPRRFDYDEARDALRRMLWGFFKKVVIADRCAYLVDLVFIGEEDPTGVSLLLGVFFFSFQIYCDFSGYSDIAIGTAKLFGFQLMQNFNYPYFSHDIVEFWQRWHISLSTWFRDYVYIPLGGNRCSRPKHLRNIFLTFVLSGLWHGANWTFVFWGALHGLYYVMHHVFFIRTNRPPGHSARNWLGRVQQGVNGIMTFGLVGLSWIFFRCETLGQAFNYIFSVFFLKFGRIPNKMIPGLILVLVFVLVEFLQRNKAHALDVRHLPVATRWGIYYVIIFLIMNLYVPAKPFIYFQF